MLHAFRRCRGLRFSPRSQRSQADHGELGIDIGKEVDIGKEGDLESKEAPTDSVQSFKTHVHALLVNRCGSCHATTIAPLFAQDDPKEAHDELLENKKIDIKDPKSSRLVARLATDNHNCWSKSCTEDAKVMLKAIEKWIGQSFSKDLSESKESIGKYQTAALTIADAKKVDRDPGTIVIEAETGEISGAMQKFDLEEAYGGAYISVPNDTSEIPNFGNEPNPNQSLLKFRVLRSGAYRLWGHVSAIDNNDNRFIVSIDDQSPMAWNLPVTGEDWAWSSPAGENGKPLVLNLDAGPTVLVVMQSKDGAKLDNVILTDNGITEGDLLVPDEMIPDTLSPAVTTLTLPSVWIGQRLRSSKNLFKNSMVTLNPVLE